MKNTLFIYSFKYLILLGIFLTISLVFNIGSTSTVSAAISNSQQVSINNELSKYKKYIAARPNQFKTQESINQFYRKLKIALISKLEILNGVIDSLPVETVSSTPTSTCSGSAPTGVGVIKSTNLTSFGGGGIPSWSFVDNTRGTNTDLGISCVWTCSPGYTRSGNGCMTSMNNTISITIQQGALYCGDPDKSNYTIYNPINKIVTLTNDIIVSCSSKGGKVWTKSSNGIIENIKNITDVKNGDIFTTNSTTTTTNPTCSGTAPTGVGVIKSTSTFGMVGSDLWSYIVNSKGTSTDLGMSCQWTCSPGYGRSGNGCAIITNPTTTTNPTCSGSAPTGVGVIKSTNLTSFGGGGMPSWSFVDNTRGTNTDLGISCVWTCSPGYTRSGNGCMVNVNPKVIWTDSSLATEKSYYKYGEKLYGYVQGGDISNTWSCIDPPDSITSCTRSTEFRKLTLETNNTPDEWQFNQTTGRIELRNGSIISSGFPAGIYISHTRTGQNGINTTTSFVVSQ